MLHRARGDGFFIASSFTSAVIPHAAQHTCAALQMRDPTEVRRLSTVDLHPFYAVTRYRLPNDVARFDQGVQSSTVTVIQ